MNEGSQRRIGYTRALAIITLIPSAIWFCLMGIPILSELNKEWYDLTNMVPLAYWLATTSLAVRTVVRPPIGLLKQHAIRGILEGAIIAYGWTCFLFLSTDSKQWSDGTFRWAVFCVYFFMAGLFISTLGAVLHLAYAAIQRRSASR
jgi:hypothetical protein